MRELVVVGAKAKPKTGKNSYKITLSTADVENAGTKDNIKLTLIGESKNLDLLLRNNLGIKKADTREYGPFEFSNENIGVIKEVRIQLDNTRSRNKFYPTKILISGDGSQYSAAIDDWVSSTSITVPAKLEAGLGTFNIYLKISYYISLLIIN